MRDFGNERRALTAHPDQFAKLKASPDLIIDAMEESLRWTTPARGFQRTAVTNTEMGGTPIIAGQRVAS